MTACERIRLARRALTEFNAILEELGQERVAYEQLNEKGIWLASITVHNGAPRLRTPTRSELRRKASLWLEVMNGLGPIPVEEIGGPVPVAVRAV